jgi:DNA processing protein
MRYGSAAAAIAALPELARAGGGLALRPIGRDLALREVERAGKLGARLLFVEGPGYPPLLALLHDAPPVLGVLGDPEVLGETSVAIVGSRNASANGQNMAEALGEGLAARRVVVVSGLARGIDGAAHTGALRTGRTVAAVAGGLDKPYPPQHEELQARIAESGAVVSEAPFGTAPQARHFPRRNRIIAGLALGVVVIEAAPRSGSLITARLALEAGRELFAVPGSPLDPRCRGSNDLIRQGAHLTETAEDVLANLPAHPAREGLQRVAGFDLLALCEPGAPPHMAEPASVWDGDAGHPPPPALRPQLEVLLSHTPISVDDLVTRCQVSAAAINGVLLEMELAGRVEFLPGQRVVLSVPGQQDLADPF